MRKAVLISLLSIFVVSLAAIAATYIMPNEISAPYADQNMIYDDMSSSEDTSSYPYLLRVYDGKLAVFTTDLVHPDMVLDIYVQLLPEYDQKELEKGIRVENYEKLTALIEDYIS